uniref:Tf2-1_6 protein n=1 Tax=Fopius arisanus TaxID=64838 RepID=A0A0C9Q0M0_9HYME
MGEFERFFSRIRKNLFNLLNLVAFAPNCRVTPEPSLNLNLQEKPQLVLPLASREINLQERPQKKITQKGGSAHIGKPDYWFRGGQLSRFIPQWTDLGAPKHILDVLKGYSIPFVQKPPTIPLTGKILRQHATKISPEMSKEIRHMLRQGVLEKAFWETGFISPMFLIPKTDGKFRQIFNLRCLNEYLQPPKFRLINQRKIPYFLQKDDFLAKIDLSQAYLHIPIKLSHRRFLCLSYKDQLFNITCLPFGLSTAPLAFSRITNWIADVLRQKGIRVVVYLDDFLLAHQDAQQLQNQIQMAMGLLRSLGWAVNEEKSTINPTHKVEFLGIIWDTHRNEMILPSAKKERILRNVQKILSSGRWNWQQSTSLLGLLNFAALVTPLGRLFSRQLQRGSRQLSRKFPRKSFPLSDASRSDCVWWKENIHQTRLIFTPDPDIFLTTDASLTGWGFQLEDVHQAGTWSEEQELWHINRKELFTVSLAIQRFKEHLRGRSVMVQSDNRTTVAYIKNQGGTRSQTLLRVVKDLWMLLDQYKIHLVPFFLPGVYNTLADRLSRNLPLPDWHLSSAMTGMIFRKWGTPEIDLFATHQSSTCRWMQEIREQSSSTPSAEPGP